MSDPHEVLIKLEPKHKYLIAIDSDGCTFDTMEIKHKECFIPNIVKYWDLQPVSKYARTAAEFVNLYSKWRGVNRFPALILTFDLLKEWPDVQKRKVNIPTAQALRDWIARESKLGNPALKAEVEKTGDPVLQKALTWSESVNASVADIVYNVPPFPFVRESLEKVSEWADVIVCSATPGEALQREWQEHDIAKYTRVIAGQEMGSKKEIIEFASNGKYSKENILMIGDAPGDMKAAKANEALFFPVKPGHEDESWEFFFKEAADKFKNGRYDQEYENNLVIEFEKLLPDVPPWK
ncbi:HAD hydrolase-like protein [candidate division KSB1 bacterium]|nr:HAD hydrolase-like protein [candidate division KSB1 bacterium]